MKAKSRRLIVCNPDAKSGMMILKVAPLPEEIVTLGVEGVNRIWREARLKAVGLKRANTLYEAAEHSIGSRAGKEQQPQGLRSGCYWRITNPERQGFRRS